MFHQRNKSIYLTIILKYNLKVFVLCIVNF